MTFVNTTSSRDSVDVARINHTASMKHSSRISLNGVGSHIAVMQAVFLLLMTFVVLGCSTTQRVNRWLVDESLPCNAVQLKLFMMGFDTLGPCERYRRIEIALHTESPPYSNRVISRLQDTSCPFSRWGISRDPRVEEELAYHLLVCYQSRMGKAWEDDEVVYRISQRKADIERDALTAVHKRSEFLSDLKTFLGCTDSTYKK